MNYRRLLRVFLAGMLGAALLAVPHLPGSNQLGLGGPAAAQEAVDVDFFYDKLDPYGQWVWHPRFGYVWLPNVREDWRPYTVGHWVYTDEYGWYWNSYEPFAWAVYHYGRWGYDQDYGWFWVPGDTWAPAWVSWRYSDNYVGWAPVGPGNGSGYAYGAPVDYDPPVAESWVFVQPRYLTSRTIYHYALPVADLNIAFLGATNVYRPVYRTGVVFNFGIPRERVVKFVNRPIVVQKIVKVTNRTVIYKNGKRVGGGGGINVFAPNLAKGAKPQRDPKRFAQSPADFRARAKLKTTLKGDAPKGLGPSAAKITPIAKEEPEGYKPKRNSSFGNLDTDTGKAVHGEKQGDKDNGRNEASGDAQGRGKLGGQGGGQGDEKENAKGDAKGPDKHGAQGKDRDNDTARGDAQGRGKQGGQGDNKGQANAVDQGNAGKGNGNGQGGTGGPGIQGGAQGSVGGAGPNSPDQGKAVRDQVKTGQPDNGPGGQGKKGRDNEVGAREQGGNGQGGGQGNDNGPGAKGKNKAVGGQGGNDQGGNGQGGNGQGGNGQGGNGGMTKAERCKKNPDAPACKNLNQ